MLSETAFFSEEILYVVHQTDGCFERAVNSASHLLIIQDSSGAALPENISGDYLILSASVKLEELMARLTVIFEHYNNWEDRILCAIDSDADLKKILELGYEQIRNPIALCDTSLNCFALCKEELASDHNSVWRSVKNQGDSDISLNALLRENHLLNRIRSEHRAFVYRLPADKESVLHLNLFFRKKRIAYLVSVGTAQPIDDYVCSVAELFGKLLVRALSAGQGMRHENLADIDLLSRKLLSGETVDGEYQAAVMSQINWSPNDRYCLCKFEIAEPGMSYDVMPDIALFQNMLQNNSIFYYGSGIVMLQNLTRENLSYESFGVKIENLLVAYGYIGGLSDEFCNYSDLKIAERKASSALRIIKKAGKKRDSNISFFGDCIVENMLDLCQQVFDLRLICRPDVYKLWSYDQKHKTSYINSLYIYLSTGKNLVESAKRLYIHRNTFVYRLGKIIELMGESAFQGTDSTLEILLSCQVILFLEKNKALEANGLPENGAGRV